MNTRANIFLLIGIGILLFIVFFFAFNANAQTQPDLFLQLAHDENGYYMVCSLGCEWYNTLGTIEEINKHFPELHCAVNWTYFLRNRHYGQNLLGYLTGPNGDTSNPLCE